MFVGCGCPYDEHDSWCPALHPPPTEREGIKVGDKVTLVAFHGARYPVEVVGFTTLDCDMVVRWLGLAPFTGSDVNTVCRKHLATVEKGSSQ